MQIMREKADADFRCSGDVDENVMVPGIESDARDWASLDSAQFPRKTDHPRKIFLLGHACASFAEYVIVKVAGRVSPSAPLR